MKNTTKLLNLLTAFMAVIGACAATLVCFIIIYTSINGNFTSNKNNAPSENIAVAESVLPTNASIFTSESAHSSETSLSDLQDEITPNIQNSETTISRTPLPNTSDNVQNNSSIDTGWTKENNLWYYIESTGKARTDNLQTDVMTFTFNPDGSCSNFYDNTTPSIQAGWSPYSTSSLDSLVNDILDGHIVYYNGQYWATPDYCNMLKNTIVVYEHDVSTNNGQSVELVDRYESASFNISFSDPETSSLTGLDNSETSQVTFYVLNTNTQKIHYSTCRDVEKIDPQNYATSVLSLSELLNQGYSTCEHCF